MYAAVRPDAAGLRHWKSTRLNNYT